MSPAQRDEPGAAPLPWAPRRRPGLLALVLLGHVALLLGWHFGLLPRVRGSQPQAPQPALVWLNLANSPRPVLAKPARPEPKPATVVPLPRPTAHLSTEVSESAPSTKPTPSVTAIHVAAPEAPASAASAPRERLMDSAATRTAIRQAGRSALLSERAASAIDQPFVSKGEQEAQAIARSAKGHCLNGEFAGGGMGLLSIPFFVVAEVGGHCAR